MSEPWFLAPERCAERGAVMHVKGHGPGCRCENCSFTFVSAAHKPPTNFQRECRHAESMYGRCANCGRTWGEQQHDRTQRGAHV